MQHYKSSPVFPEVLLTWLRMIVTIGYSVNLHPADAGNPREKATDSQKKAAHVA
jgi:hypothetical protein